MVCNTGIRAYVLVRHLSLSNSSTPTSSTSDSSIHPLNTTSYQANKQHSSMYHCRYRTSVRKAQYIRVKNNEDLEGAHMCALLLIGNVSGHGHGNTRLRGWLWPLPTRVMTTPVCTAKLDPLPLPPSEALPIAIPLTHSPNKALSCVYTSKLLVMSDGVKDTE